MSGFKLFREIVALSTSSVWDEAKLEWALNEVFESDEPDTCLCGHYPIIENCVLRNKTNGRFATVGNCCVKKFIGLPSDLIFQAMKRVRSDPSRSLNSEALAYAHERGWLGEWELGFYSRIMRMRKLTEKQVLKKQQINEKFLMRVRLASSRATTPQGH